MALRSPVLSDMPKTPSNGNKTEDALIQRTDAEKELPHMRQLFLKSLSDYLMMYGSSAASMSLTSPSA